MSRKRNLVPLLVLGIFGVLVVVAIVISRPADNKIPPKAEGWDPGQRADELNEPKTPSVSLSSLTPEQSETLVVVSDQEPVTGWFNGEPFPFFALHGRWVALVGVSAKLAPGSYDLQVVFPSQKVAERVEVQKRAFPVTQLVVTPELEEQGYTPSSIAENIALRENVMIQRAMERVAEPPYFTGPFYNPLASMNVVGAYGNIRKSGDIELQHLGLDLGAAMGTNVYAVNDGVVSFEDSLTNYGKTLIIDHGLGLYSLYLHLSEFQVSEKEEVKRGEVIARSGNTGYSIAPHLHYSMKLRGSSIDPSLFCDIVNREVFGLAGCLQRKIE